MCEMRGTLSKLFEDGLLQEKLDVVEKIYFSEEYTAGNKKGTIINWFFDLLKTFSNNEMPPPEYFMLWKKLQKILEIENRKNANEVLLIKSCSIKIVIESLKNYPHQIRNASVILSCIVTYLQTPSANSTFLVDIDSVFSLLFASLDVFCKICTSQPLCLDSLKEVKNLLNIIVDKLNNLLFMNDDDAKVVIFGKALREISTFVHLASNLEDFCSLNDSLVQMVTSVVLNVKTKSYETLLTSNALNEKQSVNPHILEFFLTLQKLLKNEETIHGTLTSSIVCASLMKRMLLTFLSQNRSGLQSFKVLCLMSAVCGLDIPLQITADSCCNFLFMDNDAPSTINVLAISNLFEACASFSQYFNTTTAGNGCLKPLDWLKGAAALLMDVKANKSKSAWFRCFRFLLRVSPSIMEADIVSLIRTALFNVTVHSAESKKEYCELFMAVLHVYAQLHQIPKFFVKFLLALTECIKENSGGKFLTYGQILKPIIDKIAFCSYELPFKQTTELWKIFIETYTMFLNMSQVFASNKGAVFFLSQIFSTFLLHAKIFDVNLPVGALDKFQDLILLTSVELSKSVTILKETEQEIQPLKRSFLILCHALGEVKLAYNICCEKALDYASHFTNHPFDCSVIHNFLNSDYAEILESALTGEDKIQNFLVFRILLQKVKALIRVEKLLNNTALTATVSTILHHVQKNNENSNSWDLDLCTLDANNYGSAAWLMLLKSLPPILNFLNHKELSVLCWSAQDIILQNYSSTCSGGDVDAKSCILSALRSEFLQESRSFQTVFVVVLWKWENFLLSKKRTRDEMDADHDSVSEIFNKLNIFRNKWFKYAETTPKSNSDQSLNSLWSNIQEASMLLNNLMVSRLYCKQKLKTDQVFNFLKLLECLPLEYLMPGNQMKCVIGLSVLLFLTSEISDPIQAHKLAKEISMLLITIFDGARSIWLFDFVTSGQYLSSILYILNKLVDLENFQKDDEWAKMLISRVISLSMRNRKSLSSLIDCFSQLLEKATSDKAVVLGELMLLQQLSQMTHQRKLQLKYSERSEELVTLSCLYASKRMKNDFGKEVGHYIHFLLLDCYARVIDIVVLSDCDLKTENKNKCLKVLPKVLKIVTQMIFEQNICDKNESYLQFISKVYKHRENISDFIYENFVSDAWQTVMSYFENKIEEQRKINMNTSFGDAQHKNGHHFASTLDQSSSFAKNHVCPFHVYKHSSDSCTSFPAEMYLDSEISLKELEINLLKSISSAMPEEELILVFQKLFQKMGSTDISTVDIISFQLSLLLLKYLIEFNEDKCRLPLLSQSIQKVLLHLHCIVNQACDSLVCQYKIIIPSLEFIRFILKWNKGLPKQIVFESLHCVTAINLQKPCTTPVMFVKSFNAAWNVVYNLLIYSLPLVLSSSAAYLSFVAILLKSIVLAGSQDILLKCDENAQQQMKLCAQNVDRLLTMISRHEKEFTKLVPYVIAEYVNSVQHVTLDTSIKDHLLSGVNRLLGICSEDSLKMLSLNLNYSCREIYTNLVKSFKQYKKVF